MFTQSSFSSYISSGKQKSNLGATKAEHTFSSCRFTSKIGERARHSWNDLVVVVLGTVPVTIMCSDGVEAR